MLDASPPVPLRSRGLWVRRLLRRAGDPPVEDTTSRVFWLQDECWHADLRVPAMRPDFSGCDRLADCDRDQLIFVASQEAFCGITRLEGETMTWARLFDLSPGGAIDAGRVRLKGGRIVETGIDGTYREEWERVADPCGARPEQLPDGRLALYARGYRVTVRPRPDAEEDFDPYGSLDTADRSALIWRASLEIALWRAEGEDWRCALSTHPWAEGNIEEGSRACV